MPRKALLQRRALALRKLPGMDAAYRLWYSLGQFAFVSFVRLTERKVVQAIYLRRGGGRNELVPAASDLDFFLVIQTLPAEQEMEFLKRFWRGYHGLRRFFPFLGEVLMGDAHELNHWLASPAVRAFEASFSWKLLAGAHRMPPAQAPDLRDLFTEALKNYADLLQVMLKLRPEQFRAGTRPQDPGAVHLRNGAKAALDLFRLHAAFRGTLAWRYSRLELTERLLGYGNLRALRPALRLHGTLFRQNPFPLYAELAHQGLRCLHELAEGLAIEADHEKLSFRLRPASAAITDAHAFSVRELFAERILLRHQDSVSKAVLAESTAGMYFVLPRIPSLAEFTALLTDLRDVNFSFERFSVAMPLTAAAYRELARSALLDSPFHAGGGYRSLQLEAEEFQASREQLHTLIISAPVLRRSFTELSFALRLQPRELAHFLEKMLGVVLALRLARDQEEIGPELPSLLAKFGERYPERGRQIRAQLAPFLPSPEEEEIWEEIDAQLGNRTGAQLLREQLRDVRALNRQRPLSPTLPSDIWINLTPVLRREMNAMKDAYLADRPELKL